MGKARKTKTEYSQLVNLSGRILKNIIFLGLMLVAVLFMFMLDKGNSFRMRYLQFMEGNFLMQLMELLHIPQMNISNPTWIVFFCILGFAFLIFIANIFSPLIIGGVIRKTKDKIKGKYGSKVLFNFIYYFIICGIYAGLMYLFYYLGYFNSLKLLNWYDTLDVLYTIAICLLFIILIAAAIIVSFVVLMLALLILSFLIATVTNLCRRLISKKSIDELERETGLGAGEGTLTVDQKKQEVEALRAGAVFPALTEMDIVAAEKADAAANADATAAVEDVENEDTLEGFVRRFQAYAITRKIYYELPLLRSFIAGLATTRLIVLEGLSGTGKSMLPRMFCDFIGTKTFFSPVQSTWRDKTDVLGFYSEFAKSFKATNFLERLYGANYDAKVNMMVLDEMNLSRIEYYFADFLSVLEYPPEDWKIRVYEPHENETLPELLGGGYVTIPTNTWFIGTANTDDSTFTITDKVYDRAIVLDFNEKFMPIKSDYDCRPVKMTAEDINKLFVQAVQVKENNLNDDDLNKFFKICDFMREAFDVRFGNRIMVQIENFVPVYVALGGTKEAALDFMFARKILRKLGGVFEDYVREELMNLSKLLDNTYGRGTFVETEKTIAKILKRLG